MNKTVIGLNGFKLPTPVWAAKLSNYLVIASAVLWVMGMYIDNWSEFIPADQMETIKSVLDAIEGMFTSTAGFLRFFGIKFESDATEEGNVS